MDKRDRQKVQFVGIFVNFLCKICIEINGGYAFKIANLGDTVYKVFAKYQEE